MSEIITSKLTGKTRYRSVKRFMREPLLVLEVEVTIVALTEPMYDCTPEEVEYEYWRDATFEDIQDPLLSKNLRSN